MRVETAFNGCKFLFNFLLNTGFPSTMFDLVLPFERIQVES